MYRPSAGTWLPSLGFGSAPLPSLAIETSEAAGLTAALADGLVTLRWKATAASPFVYNLSFPETGPVTSDRTYKVRDSKLGKSTATYEAMGVAADYVDSVVMDRPYGGRFSAAFDTVAVPGKRTEYYSAGDSAWERFVSSSFPWGESMVDPAHTYKSGSQRTESWYRGIVGPSTPRDFQGKEVLAAERQDNLIGVAPGFWADSEHGGIQGSFGDLGNMTLTSGDKNYGSSGYPSGVFEVPAEDAPYELTMVTMKVGSPRPCGSGPPRPRPPGNSVRSGMRTRTLRASRSSSRATTWRRTG